MKSRVSRASTGALVAAGHRSAMSRAVCTLALVVSARSGATAQPMQPVVANLGIGSMIDAVAFAASLRP